jgi:hypothetical protein
VTPGAPPRRVIRRAVWIRRLTLSTLALLAMSGRASGDAVVREGDGLRHFAVNVNPLGPLVGRYSLDLQVIPFLHHAIVATPFYEYITPSLPIFARSAGTATSYGGELGYHYYTGLRGPNGFFIGGGGILAHSRTDSPGSPVDDQSRAGFFVDLGFQGVTNSGFMAGAGVGYQLTARLAGTGSGSSSDPRALVMVGYAF